MKTFKEVFQESITIGRGVYQEDFPPRAMFQKDNIVLIGGDLSKFKYSTLKAAQGHYGQIGRIVGYKPRSMNSPLYVVRFADGTNWPYPATAIRGPFPNIQAAQKYAVDPAQDIPANAYTNYKNTGLKTDKKIEEYIDNVVIDEVIQFEKLDTPIVRAGARYGDTSDIITFTHLRKTEYSKKISNWGIVNQDDGQYFSVARINKERTGNLGNPPYVITLPFLDVSFEERERLGAKYKVRIPGHLYPIYSYIDTHSIDFVVEARSNEITKYDTTSRTSYKYKNIREHFQIWNAFLKATNDKTPQNIRELLLLLAGPERQQVIPLLASAGLYARGELKLRDISSLI